MTNTKFVEAVRQIAASQPIYRTGGDGNDGTCDCIGLIMGALDKKYPMHSTNYFARYEMSELQRLDALAENLPVGALLLKARGESNPRYDLHDRYKQGGRYFTGDLLDYYHVGVVANGFPLEIIHCTSTGSINGIAYDYSLDGWTHAGVVGGLNYNEEETNMSIMMEVYAANGKPVNVRQRPSTAAPKVGEVDVGKTVTVTEQADGWAKITHGSLTGYMMSRFLLKTESKTETPGTDQTEEKLVTIQLPESVAEELCRALRFLD